MMVLSVELQNWINRILVDENIHLKHVKPRKSKLGDYRKDAQSTFSVITINKDLKDGMYLNTVIHEIAHGLAYNRYGYNIKPHGQEWKTCYQELLLKAMDFTLNEDQQRQLLKALQKPRASYKSTQIPEGATTVGSIPKGSAFQLRGSKKTFIKGKKLRTRFKCREKNTFKHYSIASNAVVTKCNP